MYYRMLGTVSLVPVGDQPPTIGGGPILPAPPVDPGYSPPWARPPVAGQPPGYPTHPIYLPGSPAHPIVIPPGPVDPGYSPPWARPPVDPGYGIPGPPYPPTIGGGPIIPGTPGYPIGPVDPGYSPPWARPPVDPGYSPPWAQVPIQPPAQPPSVGPMPPDLAPPTDEPIDLPDLASPGYGVVVVMADGSTRPGWIQTAINTSPDHTARPPENGLPGEWVAVYASGQARCPAPVAPTYAWVPTPASPAKAAPAQPSASASASGQGAGA